MPVELFYREKGRRENPPLILLHGLWGASDNWLPVAETLSGRFRVILPDLRNHGQSPRHPEHTYAILGEDVEALIHRLALSSPPFMAGHSMGGKCLMYLLLKTPGIARKAAVIDISPKTYDTPGEGLHRKLLDFFSRFTFIPGEKRTALHQRIRREIGDEQTCQIVFKNLQRDTSGFHWRLHTDALSRHLAELTSWLPPENSSFTPVLFIRGGASAYVKDEDVPGIRNLFPAASFTTITGASHWIHAEKPKELADTLGNYFLP